MDNHIITILQNFQKPEASFLQDKECLICLETFDLELNKIVKLPCGCSNSVYHINCIIQFLKSGTSKNFCPHCKINYNILQPVLEDPPVLNNNNNNNNDIRMFVTILYIHILSNSIMNVINISESREYPQEDANIVSKLLLICYFCKLLVNICIVCKIRANIEKIESYTNNLHCYFNSLKYVIYNKELYNNKDCEVIIPKTLHNNFETVDCLGVTQRIAINITGLLDSR